MTSLLKLVEFVLIVVLFAVKFLCVRLVTLQWTNLQKKFTKRDSRYSLLGNIGHAILLSSCCCFFFFIISVLALFMVCVTVVVGCEIVCQEQRSN